MKPGRKAPGGRGFAFLPQQSEFDREMENAKRYFGDDFPGNEGITCLMCGALVNLGWVHIAWHEAQS